jgi:hypothetical protein
MDEMGLVLVPSMESFEMIEIKDSKAKFPFIMKMSISYTWINADNPQEQVKSNFTFIEEKMIGCQGIGSVMTYAERYFLCKFFQIATDKDDPDAFKKKHAIDQDEEEEPKEEDISITNVCNSLALLVDDKKRSFIPGFVASCKEKSKGDFQKLANDLKENTEKLNTYLDKWIEKNMKR